MGPMESTAFLSVKLVRRRDTELYLPWVYAIYSQMRPPSLPILFVNKLLISLSLSSAIEINFF